MEDCENALVKVRLCTFDKYGYNQKGVFLDENVTKGTKLWARMTADKSVFTRDELIQLKLDKPHLSDNIDSFSCQSGHDRFTIPTSCLSIGDKIDFRQYVNHSCDPNCGYVTEDNQTFTIALRNIMIGEELTIHYGMLETEISFTYGLECKCGATNCHGTWTLDLYRTDSELLKYAKPELVSQINEFRTKFWYSSSCWLKQCSSKQKYGKSKLSLFTRDTVNANECVARFVDGIHRYIKIVEVDANCFLDGNNIVAKRIIQKNEEITIY